MKTNLNKGSHSVYSIHLHLVFVTKYRRKVLSFAMLERMKEIFAGVCEKAKSELIEFSGESDHVHLLVSMAPHIKVSQLVTNLKASSSRIVRKEFASEIRKVYSKPVLWHHAYCAISASGAPLSTLVAYIQNQKVPN